MLKQKGIGETEISKKFNISRRAVYNYYKSENLSNKVKQRFLEKFNINLNKQIHSSQYEREGSVGGVGEPSDKLNSGSSKQSGNLKDQIQELQQKVEQLKTACVEKDKRIESLENMLKIALKPDSK